MNRSDVFERAMQHPCPTCGAAPRKYCRRSSGALYVRKSRRSTTGKVNMHNARFRLGLLWR